MTTPLLATQPEDTPPAPRRSSFTLIIFLLIGFGAGLAVGYFSWGNPLNPNKAAAAAPTTQAAAQHIDVPIGTAPVWGSANAKVTIIEFSDYECPYCKKWHAEIWPQIQKAYPDQIKLVYKDFPLSPHPNASPAAAAARCANDQNQYWAFHDLIFSSNSLSSQVYEQIATKLGLDLAKWKDCVKANKYDADIEADYSYGEQLGINGTPTFFINGVPMVGAQPFSAFKQVIDQELASAKN
jgi:protein-disulfide isomerase